MSAAPHQPLFRDAAHRRAAMQRLQTSIVPAALAFGALAPLVGLAVTGAGQLVRLLTALAGSEVRVFDAIARLGEAMLSAWIVAAPAGAIAGVWVAVLSPFVPNKLQFYAGVVVIGVMTSGLFLLPLPANASVLAGPMLPVAGALSAAICARLFTNWPLARGEDGRAARRDRFARERAARLAKARAAG